MNFGLTEERQMLQGSLRRYLRDNYSNEKIKALIASDIGYSNGHWTGLSELGVIGALFSESDGGYGGAGFDIAVVFEELGRIGAVEPLLDTAVLCGGVLTELGNPTQKALVQSIIDGSLQLAMAHAEPKSRYEMARVETTAKPEGKGYRLDGQKSVVVNASVADHFIISTRIEGEVASGKPSFAPTTAMR